MTMKMDLHDGDDDDDDNEPSLFFSFPGRKHTNSCQFFVTFKDLPWISERYVIFGKVLDGMIVARQIQNVEVDEADKPLQEVKITACGEIQLNKPFEVTTGKGSDEL